MRKEKKLYHLLNEATLPEQVEIEPMNAFEKERILKAIVGSKREKKRKNQIRWAFAVAVLFLVASLNPVRSTVQAAVASFLETIQYTLRDMAKVEDAPSDATIKVGQTAIFDEIELKLEDVALIDHTLYVHFLVDFPETAETLRPVSLSSSELSINGSLLVDASAGGSGQLLDEEQNIHSQIMAFEIPDEILYQEKFTLDINTKKIQYYEPDKFDFYSVDKENRDSPLYFATDANFRVETNVQELTSHTKLYTLIQSIPVDSEMYMIDQFVTHPILSYFQLTLPTFQLIEMIGENEDGNKVVFNTGAYTITEEKTEQQLRFDSEKSEITNQELIESGWIEVQFYSAGLPEGQATFVPYGEPFRIDLKNPDK